ncbi:MAG TPA: hypothetical protein P5229_04895 [Candidatus Gracilibacteria bacterium]|nr:hypothetical protein [Candidatus Gracilibacteria bacterium]
MSINVMSSPYRMSFPSERRKRTFAGVQQSRYAQPSRSVAEGRSSFSRGNRGNAVAVAMQGVMNFGGLFKDGFSFKAVSDRIRKVEIGPVALVAALGLIAALLMVCYLAAYNQIATKGYDLKRLEADHQQLMRQYDIRNMKLASVRSMANMIDDNKFDGMRKPSQIDFARGEAVLALK